jgi:peroxiredoxin Q/BCP
MPMMPNWRMPGSDGRTWNSAELAGQTYVLYFYPKDQTPGCTAQACDFRDNIARLQAANVKVFGVSPDSLASHQKFVAKEKLTFPLLTDNDHMLASKLGVWTEKALYGRAFLGIERSTFLVGPDGTIVREWRNVKVTGHVAEVLGAIAAGPAGKYGVTPEAARAALKAAELKAAQSQPPVVPGKPAAPAAPIAKPVAAPLAKAPAPVVAKPKAPVKVAPVVKVAAGVKAPAAKSPAKTIKAAVKTAAKSVKATVKRVAKAKPPAKPKPKPKR